MVRLTGFPCAALCGVLATVLAGAASGQTRPVPSSVPAITTAAPAAPPAAAPKPGEPAAARAPINLASFAVGVMAQWDAAIYFRLWEAGSTLDACFYNGTPADRALIAGAVQTWSKYANLKFAFGPAPNFSTCTGTKPAPQIRIKFISDTANSFAGYTMGKGTETVGIAADKETFVINLVNASGQRPQDTSIIKTAIHEMGHLIGLAHMHQHPSAKCFSLMKWSYACSNWGKFKEAKSRTQMAGYTTTNMAPRSALVGIAGFPYDPQSVMHYRFPAALFTNPDPSCVGPPPTDISAGDKAMIAKLYPKDPAIQRAAILEHGRLVGRYIAGIKGLTDPEMRALVRRGEQLVRAGHPNLDFKLDTTGFIARPRLEFVGSQWTTAERLQYGRGVEAPDKCGLTPPAGPSGRPAAASVPAIPASAPTDAPVVAPTRRTIINLQKK